MEYTHVRIIRVGDSAFGQKLKVLLSTDEYVIVEMRDGDKRTFKVSEVEWCDEVCTPNEHSPLFLDEDTQPDYSPITTPPPELEIPDELFDEGDNTVVQPCVFHS